MSRPLNNHRSSPLPRHGPEASTAAAAASDILTEDIDQAILHFTAAVKENNQSVIHRTVLFVNEVLTRTSWRDRDAREGREAEDAVEEEGGGWAAAHRGPGPTLQQWVDALESLTAAALPTAFAYLRDLYRTATTWSVADRRCSVAVLNMVFFILVLYTQTERQVAVHVRQYQRRLRQQQLHATAVDSPGSTIAPFLFTTLSLPSVSMVSPAETQAVQSLQRRVQALYEAQQVILTRYLCFIAWSAEAQLHAVKVSASVRIRGMPLLSELPRVPLYLSEHDGWIWLWMVTLLYGTLQIDARAEGGDPVAGAGTAPLNGGHPHSAATTSAGSPPATLTALDHSGRPHSPSGSPAHRSGVASPDSSRCPGNAIEDSSTTAAAAAAAAAATTRSAVVRLLLQMLAHDGGELYAHKLLAVLLSSFELFTHHWTRGQPVMGELFREWSQRIVHNRLQPNVVTLPHLRSFFSGIASGALDELTRMVAILDDVVSHAACLFFSSTRPLLRLHQLLEQLIPLHVAPLLLYPLHPAAHPGAGAEAEEDEETFGDFRFPDVGDEWHSSEARSRRTDRRRPKDACAAAIYALCTGVSRLLSNVAELLLEPHTQRTSGFNTFQLPQSLCAAMLKNTIMFIASEVMLQEEFWAALRSGYTSSGNGGGREGSHSTGAALRRQWRWWAVWTNTAHFVCVAGGRFGEREESDDDLLLQQRRRDVFYVQAIALAIEDVYALLRMIASTATGTNESAAAARSLGLIFLRLRLFFVRLHEEHVAAIHLHVVNPFSALREDTFNAFAQLLEHYVAVTARTGDASTLAVSVGMAPRASSLSHLGSPPRSTVAHPAPATTVPVHRSLWLLAVAYLRLATFDSALLCNANSSGGVSNAQAAASSAESKRHLLSTHNFACASPFVSMFYLRDRTYESSEDWMQQPDKWKKNILSRNGTEVPQLRDAAHLFRCYRGEVQQTEDAARELLLLASVRLLSAAVRAAANAQQTQDETEGYGHSASSYASPPHALHPESQASVYVTAFSRYLCMMKDISSACLFFLLQSIRDELRTCSGEREASGRPSNASAVAESNCLGERDLLDARTFELEVSLYSV